MNNYTPATAMEEAKKYRKQGLTYTKIGELIGCSYSQARELCLSDIPAGNASLPFGSSDIVMKELYHTPISKEVERRAVRNFSKWLVNIARTQMARPEISADQLELGTEDYIIRYISEEKTVNHKKKDNFFGF
jgi:hypothetical protein